MLRVVLNELLVRRFLHDRGEELAENLAKNIVKDARSNASAFASEARTRAITYEMDEDSKGPFARVGYDKNHPGFVLWWSEVGTATTPPRPHLRPAVARNR